MALSKLNPIATFFERLGHKVIQSPSGYWYEVQPKVLLSLPYYKLIEPTEDELNSLVDEHRLRAIRYPTPLSSYGFLSNVAVNTTDNYGLFNLRPKARNQTIRGLENCKVERLDFDWLIDNGLPLNISTAQRQGRESRYSDPEYWRKYCQAAKSVDGLSAWGAFVEGKLVSFLVSVSAEGNWQEWVVNNSLTELRNKYPNNALSFTVAQNFLNKEKSNGICYGLGSLEEARQLDHFKKGMGWTVQPIKQRLIFSKKLRCIFPLAQEPCLKILTSVFPKNYNIRKTSAMIRLYRKQTLDVPATVPVKLITDSN